jgi:LmbE family N-acetylglucosaminyl deacetylase
MDDEVLACGGTIARLSHKERIHVIYATDGSRSPAPVLPWLDSVSPNLGLMRLEESRAALKMLGVPDTNLHFLGFPEGRLKKDGERFSQALTELVRQIKPAHLLIPFRYDRHPDHLMVNRVMTAALRRGDYKADLLEYFVYYRSRLLPGGDIRKYIHPDHLIRIDIETVSINKRRALECFKTQTTRLYGWQDRPILSKALLDEECRNSELFLKYNPLFPATRIFTKAHTWIRFAHLIETPLKRRKDKIVALLYRGKHGNARKRV